jgi:hypothetical protein
VLDGLDGKQARLKVETNRTDKIEHWFDAVFEMSWWIALAWHFKPPANFRVLWLLASAAGSGSSGWSGESQRLFYHRKGDRRAWRVRALCPARRRKAQRLHLDPDNPPSAIGNFIRNRHLFSIRLRD